MFQITKKTIFTSLLFLSLISLLLITPFKWNIASAGFWDFLGDLGEDMLAGAFKGIVGITSFFLTFASDLLHWVITDFISVKFTDNPIVNVGWTTVRDFTNMFFVLVLVAIALGTTLRIREYEVKKLLPILIGIALLINFTPVICGFIIDACNIIMNTFLSGGFLSDGFERSASNEVSLLTDETLSNTERVARGTVLAGFNLVGGIIFLLFALLFAVRYVVLWILIILSPIAFFCYILPQTRGIWSKWWNQFIQWCIIGIIGGFFLYLTNITITVIVNQGGLVNKPKENIGVGTELVMYIVPLIFMVIGFFVSITTSAIGADKISAGFGGLVKGAVKGTTKKGALWAKKRAGETKISREAKERTKRGLEKVSEKAYIPKIWKRERARIDAMARHRAEREKDVEAEKEKMKHMSTNDREIYAAKQGPLAKVAKFRLNSEQGHLRDEDLSGKNLKLMKSYGTPNDLAEAAKKRLDYAAKLDPEKVRKKMDDLGITQDEAEKLVIREKVEGRSPIKIRQDTQAEAFKHKDVVFSLNKNQIKEVTERGSSEQKKNIYDTYIKEVENLTGKQIRYGSMEELRDSVYDYRKDIGREIDRLKNTGKPEDSIKAQAMEEIGSSIQKRKF